MAPIHAELGGDFLNFLHAEFSFERPNLHHCFTIKYLPFLVAILDSMLNKTHLAGMNLLAALVNPFKILWSVIGLYSIDMINLIVGRARSMEGETDKSMNRHILLSSPFVENRARVSVLVDFEFEGSFGPDAVYATKAGYVIQTLPSNDGTPNFSGILKVIHDGFLLHRKWLWLEAYHCLPQWFASSSLAGKLAA